MSVLSRIRRYRELQLACETGQGLAMAEVLSMEELGQVLRNRAAQRACSTIGALISVGKDEFSVSLDELGPDSVTCSACPRITPGSCVSLRLDDSCKTASYLFRVSITAAHFVAADDRWTLQLALIGSPVVLNWGRGRPPSSDAVLELEKNLRAA